MTLSCSFNLIFFLPDDINRVLEQQWTDFNRSSYNTRNNMSWCCRILQRTWRRQLPFSWSVEGKWYVLGSIKVTKYMKSDVYWMHNIVPGSLLSAVIRNWEIKNLLYHMGIGCYKCCFQKKCYIAWSSTQSSVTT